MSSRDAVLGRFAQLGVATVPLAPRSKRPLRAGWQRADADAWRDAPAEANVGVLAGQASGGLVVLDFDDPEVLHGVLGMSPRSIAAHTIVVKTARGYHVYARAVGVATRVPREGFSLLGEGSLAVAPPSVHPSGFVYSFLGDACRIAMLSEFALPEELVERPAKALAGRSERPSGPEIPSELAALSEEDAFGVVRSQSGKVVSAWRLLTSAPPPDRAFDGSGTDAWSRADFLVALCLIQHGHEPERVAGLLVKLQGSKAAVRGWAYAMRTCARAAETARKGRLPARSKDP